MTCLIDGKTQLYIMVVVLQNTANKQQQPKTKYKKKPTKNKTNQKFKSKQKNPQWYNKQQKYNYFISFVITTAIARLKDLKLYFFKLH